MSAIIAAIGGGSFVLTSWVLGPRLMLLSRRTGESPEFLIGLGLFLMAALGYPLLALSQMLVDAPHATRMTLLVASCLAGAVGQCSVTLFTRRVFRPDSAWATVLMVTILVSYPLAFAVHAGSPGLETLLVDKNGPWRITLYVTLVNIGWAGLESLNYWQAARKRVAIGLADPVVTNRIGLWALGILSAAAISLITIVLQALGIPSGGANGLATQGILVGLLGAVCSVSLWLAFLPPRWYTRRFAPPAPAVA